MNTDNTAVSGETIDYGPCAFMDTYDPGTVFSSIDHRGRYAYANQPRIAAWNLARLAEAILPLLADDREHAVAMANEVIGQYAALFSRAFVAGLRRKLGLFTEGETDAALAQALLDAMAANHADFTLTFRRMCAAAETADGDAEVRELFDEPEAWDEWAPRWRQRLAEEPQTPRGACGLDAAGQPRLHPAQPPGRGGAGRGHRPAMTTDRSRNCSSCCRGPTRTSRRLPSYTEPPGPEQRVYRTFCGT